MKYIILITHWTQKQGLYLIFPFPCNLEPSQQLSVLPDAANLHFFP